MSKQNLIADDKSRRHMEENEDQARAPIERLVESRIREFVGKLGPAIDSETALYELFMRQFERPLIRVMLEAVGGNQLRAAHILGINRNTLRKKITNLSIAPVNKSAKGKS